MKASGPLARHDQQVEPLVADGRVADQPLELRARRPRAGRARPCGPRTPAPAPGARRSAPGPIDRAHVADDLVRRSGRGRRQPARHQPGAIAEELLVGEDAAGAGRQGAPPRQLVVMLGHGHDRQPRGVQATDGRHGVEAARSHVHDGAAQGGLVSQLVRLEGHGQLRVRSPASPPRRRPGARPPRCAWTTSGRPRGRACRGSGDGPGVAA